jgi:hypothetical protein
MIKELFNYLFGRKAKSNSEQWQNFFIPEKKKDTIKEPKSVYVIQSRLKKRRRRAFLSQQSRLANAYMK